MLFQQNGNSGDIDERQKRSIKFVIACKYPAKPFELLKEAFNQMAFFVGVPVHRPRNVDVAFRRNRIDCILRINVVPDHFGPIGFISENIAPLDIDPAEQRDSVLGIVVIAGTEQKSKRIAQAIHQSMNFRVSAASGYAYCPIPRFFPHHWRFNAPCRMLNRLRYSQSQRR